LRGDAGVFLGCFAVFRARENEGKKMRKQLFKKQNCGNHPKMPQIRPATWAKNRSYISQNPIPEKKACLKILRNGTSGGARQRG